ncbi:hypothetical protein BDF21DRAFT_331641, partial [Thamnidium elegans]
LFPIEELWSNVKAGIKRSLLDIADRFTLRIMDAVTPVALKDCCGWLRYSVSFFPVVTKEEML